MTTGSVPSLDRPPAPITRKAPPLRAVVYHDPKTGGTTLGLSASKPLVIDTDGGLEGDAVLDVTGLGWTPDKWSDLNALYFAMKAKGDEFDTWVIDTADSLNRFLLQESVDTYTGANRGTNAGQLTLGGAVPERRDYNATTNAWDRFLTMLRQSRKDVVILVHAEEPEPEKGVYKRHPAINPATLKLLEQWANVYGELVVVEKDGKERRVLLMGAGDPLRRAGTRFRTLGRAMVEPTIPKLKAAIARSFKSTPEGETK